MFVHMFGILFLLQVLCEVDSSSTVEETQEICSKNPGNITEITNDLEDATKIRNKIIITNSYNEALAIESDFEYIRQKFAEVVKIFENNLTAKPCLSYILGTYNVSLDVGINQVLECCVRHFYPGFVDDMLEEIQDELNDYLNSTEKCPSTLSYLTQRAKTVKKAATYYFTYIGNCSVYARKYILSTNEESKTYFEMCILDKTKVEYKIDLTKPK